MVITEFHFSLVMVVLLSMVFVFPGFILLLPVAAIIFRYLEHG